MSDSNELDKKVEPEHTGPAWTHPYILYVLLTIAIFGFMLFIAWFARNADLIPHRVVN